MEPSPKAWASGRVLSEAQRNRKREHDKKSIREKRQSTQRRIAQLEETISFLESPIAANLRILRLGDHIERLKHGNENRSKIQEKAPDVAGSDRRNRAAVEPLLQRDKYQLFSSHTPQDRENSRGLPPLPVESEPISPSSDAEGEYPNSWCSANLKSKIHPSTCIVGTPTPHILETSVLPQQVSIVTKARRSMCPVSARCPSMTSSATREGSGIGEKASIVRACNLELTKAHLLRKNQVSLDDRINQDVLIRAVLHGWDIVERRGNFCPLWGILRFFDNNIFWVADITTRLVMLRMIHYMLLCQVKAESFKELPPWYRPRPVQYQFSHETIMSYFAWPGLRERLILSSQPMLTDSFCDIFAKSFRFHWPDDFGVMYLMNPQTGLLQFSGTFTNHLHEISTWRMDTAFFDAYPETYDDITPAESVTQIFNFGAYHSRPAIDQRSASEVDLGDHDHWLRENDHTIPSELVSAQDSWNIVSADLPSVAASNSIFGDYHEGAHALNGWLTSSVYHS